MHSSPPLARLLIPLQAMAAGELPQGSLIHRTLPMAPWEALEPEEH